MRGGKRAGSGRPKGAVNSVSAAKREALAAEGELPLDYMLRVMRDKTTDHARRDDMAKAAAKFCHATLAAIEHTGKDGGKIGITITSDDARL